MRKLLGALLSFLIAFASAAPLAAQDDVDSLEALMMKEAAITVASRKAETVFNSVSNVTVITRETIERFNFGSVSEALETVAGVMVWRTYFIKKINTFRGLLQENYATKSLVMINNVPMWHGVTGEGYVDRVPIQAVERIEILRGPASVLYGSNALTGAVNIVLKQPKKGDSAGQIAAGVGTGHSGYQGSDVEAGRAVAQYASTMDDKGFNIAAGLVSESWPVYTFRDEKGVDTLVSRLDRARSVTATGQWGGHSLLANVADIEEDFMGTTPDQTLGVGRPHERDLAAMNYSYTFGPDIMNLKYSVTYDRQRRNFARNNTNTSRTDTLGSRITNTVSASKEIVEHVTLEVGGDHDYRRSYRYVSYNPLTGKTLVNTGSPVESENELRDRTVWEGSLYAQLGYDQEPWRAVFGSRYTSNQLFGDDFSSRGSVVYEINEKNSVKAVAGQAYRSPTLFELYFLALPTGAGGVVGNPKLNPEKVTSAEISYLTAWNNIFGQITGYWEEHKQRIFRSQGTFTRNADTFAGVNFYANGNRYNARGIEMEVRYRAPKTEAYVALDYIDGNHGDNTSVNGFLASATQIDPIARDQYNFKNVPRYTLSGGVYQAFGKFWASANANAYSSMDTLRTRIGNNAWADASVGYKSGRWRHAFAVKNVTGQQVLVPEYTRQRVVENVPLHEGRRAEYTLSYSF